MGGDLNQYRDKAARFLRYGPFAPPQDAGVAAPPRRGRFPRAKPEPREYPDTPFGELIRGGDPWAGRTARERAESAVRGLRMDADLEELKRQRVGEGPFRDVEEEPLPPPVGEEEEVEGEEETEEDYFPRRRRGGIAR